MIDYRTVVEMGRIIRRRTDQISESAKLEPKTIQARRREEMQMEMAKLEALTDLVVCAGEARREEYLKEVGSDAYI